MSAKNEPEQRKQPVRQPAWGLFGPFVVARLVNRHRANPAARPSKQKAKNAETPKDAVEQRDDEALPPEGCCAAPWG